jgi:hypothetical protein
VPEASVSATADIRQVQGTPRQRRCGRSKTLARFRNTSSPGVTITAPLSVREPGPSLHAATRAGAERRALVIGCVNKVHAAEQLRIGTATLYRRLKQYEALSPSGKGKERSGPVRR